ncbi:MAG: hypothetical protein JOZ69_25160, partial [Myxococcales bacterium]|nr:hypothetical protein [Myxococcales bacterium]
MVTRMGAWGSAAGVALLVAVVAEGGCGGEAFKLAPGGAEEGGVDASARGDGAVVDAPPDVP